MYKPSEPIKGEVQDFRCHELNEDFEPMGQDFEGDEDYSDRYYRLREINLEDLVLAFREYNLKDIVITVCDGDLIFLRPENAEEFAARYRKYEAQLEEYNRSHRKLSPEEKEQKKRQKKADKANKLLAEAKKIQEELESQPPITERL